MPIKNKIDRRAGMMEGTRWRIQKGRGEGEDKVPC